MRWATGSTIHGTTCLLSLVDTFSFELGSKTGHPLLDDERSRLPPLPDWGIEAIRLTKQSVFKCISTYLVSPKGDWAKPARILGVAHGMIDRFRLFTENQADAYFGDCELTQEQSDRLERRFRDFRKFPKLIEVIDAIQETPEPFDYGHHFRCKDRKSAPASVDFMVDYWHGYAKGMEMLVDNQGNWVGASVRFDILESLLAFWPDIELMRKSNPPMTRVDLLKWLKDRCPGIVWGDEQERFDKICDEIGLSMKAPGGPHGKRQRR